MDTKRGERHKSTLFLALGQLNYVKWLLFKSVQGLNY